MMMFTSVVFVDPDVVEISFCSSGNSLGDGDEIFKKARVLILYFTFN